jgi:hypothetical protein
VGGPGPGADLEREGGGVEEGELHGLENGVDLLPLGGEQALPGECLRATRRRLVVWAEELLG